MLNLFRNPLNSWGLPRAGTLAMTSNSGHFTDTLRQQLFKVPIIPNQ